jgi:hypothetical protein
VILGRIVILVGWTLLCFATAVFAVLVLMYGDCAPEVVNCHPRGPLDVALVIIGLIWLLITIGMIRSWKSDA